MRAIRNNIVSVVAMLGLGLSTPVMAQEAPTEGPPEAEQAAVGPQGQAQQSEQAPLGPQGQSPQPDGQNQPHARVSFVQGQYFVRGPFDSEEQNLVQNSIIREGDIVRSGENSFAEIELPNESFIRMSSNAVARVDRIAGAIELTLIEGAAYFSNGASSGDALVIASAQGSMQAAPGTIARIEVTRVDQTTIARVARGDLGINCNGQAQKLGAGESLTCSQALVQRGQWDPKQGDAFDHWNAEREDHVRHYSEAPPEVAGRYEGLYDLEGHGQWVYVDNGWYWQPTVASDWRPYYDGYWSWYGAWGWTWMPYAPWGYVTHHYGRWLFRTGYGWVWSPAPVWAGSWVVWASFGGYLGWAPCDFWGRPIVFAGWYSHYDYRVWSFGHPRYFYQGGGNWHHQHEWAQRPFFTMSHEQLSSVRGTPIHDPSRSLAPSHASPLMHANAVPGGHLAAGSARGGEALSHLVERANTEHLSANHFTASPSSARPSVSSPRSLQSNAAVASHAAPSSQMHTSNARSVAPRPAAPQSAYPSTHVYSSAPRGFTPSHAAAQPYTYAPSTHGIAQQPHSYTPYRGWGGSTWGGTGTARPGGGGFSHPPTQTYRPSYSAPHISAPRGGGGGGGGHHR
jgi:hypothetical protein